MANENTAPDGYDEFSNVFDELMEKEDNATNTDEPADPSDGTDLPAGDAPQQVQPTDGTGDPAQSAGEGGDPAASDGTGSQDGQGGDPAGGQQGDQGVVNWEAKYAELEARLNSMQQQQAPAPTPAPAPAPAEQPIFTAEEAAELETLKADWPDLVKLFSLMGRQLQVDTLKYAFNEVGKVISPLQESVNTYTTNDHMAAIYEAHEDYDQVYKPVMDWIEKQPSFLKAAYQNVVKQGTADDVNTMIQRFKDETKWAAPAQGAQGVGGSRPTTPAAAASTPPQQQTGLSEAAKKAAQAMGAVGTKRGAPSNAVDPSDFDSAWDEAISADS